MARIVAMLVVMVGLLLGGHFLIFRFFALAVTDPSARLALFATLAVLSISFPAAAVLVHTRANAVTETYYVIAAVWIGLFVNLLLAIGVIRLALFGADLAGLTVRRDLVVLAGGAAAALATAVGAWRALHPRLVHHRVALAGLPEAWHGKRLVQLSDVHLGFVNRQRFAERMVERVNAARPELVVITGDLVDGMGGNFCDLLRALDRLQAPRGVYFASGNHETYNGVKRIRRALAETRIRVLDDQLVDLDGLRLIGVAYPGLDGDGNHPLLEQLRSERAANRAGILLFHTPTNFDRSRAVAPKPDGDVLVDEHFSTYWVPDVSCARARELGIGLQLSGHTHAGQLFPFNLVARAIFRGFHYGLHRSGEFQIYISSGTGTWGPPVRLGTRSEIPVFTLQRG